MTTKKITENLKWASIKERYFMGEMLVDGKTVKVDQLTAAFVDGTFWNEIVECADALYEGNTYEVLLCMSKNLSSILVNIGKRPDSATKAKDLRRCDMLRNFIKAKMDEDRKSRTTSDKAYWQWTLEEIEAIPLSDYRTIKSVYDNMASRKAKYPDAILDMDDFMMRYKAVSAKKSAARKAMQSESSVDAVAAQKVLDTLKGDGKRLTKADKEVLIKLLEGLSK